MNIITQAGKYDTATPVGDTVWIRPILVEIDPVSSSGNFCPGLVRQLKETDILSGIRWPDGEGGQWYPLRFKPDQGPYIDLTESGRSFTFNEARDLGMKVQEMVTKALDRAFDFLKFFIALDADGKLPGLQDVRGRLEGLLAEVKDARGIPARLGEMERSLELSVKHFKERIDNLDQQLTHPTADDIGARISMLGRRCGRLEPQMEDALKAIASLIDRVNTLEVKPQETKPEPKRRSRKPAA